MRAFNSFRRMFQLLIPALLCAIIVPNRLLADEKETSNPAAKAEAAKPAPAKSDAPKFEASAPLTERERWLLDRVEQLEKRVAELETKSNSPAAATAAAPFSRPGSLSPTTSSVAASPAVVSPSSSAAEEDGETTAGLAATLDVVGLNEPGRENGAAAVAAAGELLLVSSSATRFSSCSTRSSSHRSRSVNGADASNFGASLFAGAGFAASAFAAGLLVSFSSASKRLGTMMAHSNAGISN